MNIWPNQKRGALLLGAFLALSAAYIWIDEAYVPDLNGQWVSRSCETIATPGGGLSRLRRSYVIGDESWHLDLTFYDDPDCAKKLFALGIDGRYELGAKSPKVRGATEARFGLEKLKLTPYTDEMSVLFSQGKCGNGPWMTGVGQDVSRNGCLEGIPSVRSCPVEYDIVERSDDELRFGERSRTLCLPGLYPSKLGDPLLKKE
jgi:hypothetical protein